MRDKVRLQEGVAKAGPQILGQGGSRKEEKREKREGIWTGNFTGARDDS